MRNAGLEEAQAGIKIARRNISNLRYADDTTLMAESEEELKSLLMKVKEESEKVGLKLKIQKTKIMPSNPITSWEIDGETEETVADFIFLGSLPLLCQQMSVQSRLWFFQWLCMDVRVGLWRKLSMEELIFWTVVLEKTLESPLDCKEIQPVHSRGDQSWVFIGRTDAEAETPILWPPHAKSWPTGKDPDAGREWGQKEKGTTEDEMAGCHHRLDGHEFG